jgi:hypothetical protein
MTFPQKNVSSAWYENLYILHEIQVKQKLACFAKIGTCQLTKSYRMVLIKYHVTTSLTFVSGYKFYYSKNQNNQKVKYNKPLSLYKFSFRRA